ncbi:MAG: hypothetical protein A2V66_14875 [Ignavibacteria bacterium RBG_13_36_8]|nr:MAG: hypothetical protein A2V66_14875 [Ignavibacteria bacterium RBG_13_36_8]
MKNLWNNIYLRHLAYWLAAFAVVFLSVFIHESSKMALEIATLIILPAPLPVYSHYYVLERFFANRKYLHYAVSFAVIIFISGLWCEYIFDLLFSDPGSHTSGYITAFFYIIISTAMRYSSEIIKNKYYVQEAEFKQLQTEVSLLKSQINPHFFFNTLNNLYALSLAKSEEVPSVILKLSDMMRYVLDTSKQKYVSLEKEIDFLKNYIELEKLRFEEKSKITINVEGKIDELKIAPMLLVPFIENSFKHGIGASHSGGFININIDFSDGFFNFSVVNSKPADGIGLNEKSSKLGLANVQRRLELLYPDKHVINIKDTDQTFEVKLKISI